MITREKLNHHITHLEEKHRTLDNEIASLKNVNKFDDTKIAQLKKEKLHIKDEIEQTKLRLDGVM